MVVQRPPPKVEAHLEIQRVQNIRGFGRLHQRKTAIQGIAELRGLEGNTFEVGAIDLNRLRAVRSTAPTFFALDLSSGDS